MTCSMTVPAARMPANSPSVHVQASAEHNFVIASGKLPPHILKAGILHQFCPFGCLFVRLSKETII